MIILDLVQGSPEWIQHRILARNASEAPIVMMASDKQSRSSLVEAKATGCEKDIPDFVREVIFDKGHKVEELARPFAEEFVGDDLCPLVATDDEKFLSVSFDGITMNEKILWECKQWNASKAEEMDMGDVPAVDFWQCIQQMLVSGAEELIYTLSDGTEEGTKHVRLTRARAADFFDELLAGWKQFDDDVANYQPREKAPEVTATATEALPAVSVQVQGSLAVVDNFDRFESALKHFIDAVLIRDPQTDQDFADLDSQVKALKKAEDALDAAEGQLLAQVEAVDTAKRRKDMLHKLARDNRLMAEKLVKSQKQAIKVQIAQDGRKSVDDHLAKVQATLDGYTLPQCITDFNTAMKGKRTITTLRDAADDEVARAKIQINEAADLIRVNAKTIADAGYEFLFADRQQLALKDSDFVKLQVENRIAYHKQEEQKRIDAERARIQAEEQAKAEAEARRKVEAEAAAKRDEERKQAEEQAAAQRQAESEARAAAESEQQNAAKEIAETKQPEPVKQQTKPADQRPTDHQILAVISAEWGVGMEKAAEWLLSMNTEKLQEMQAA